MNKNLIEKIAPQLTELMIKKMETLTGEWRKPWIADLAHGLPRNLRGTHYRGGNILMLLFLQEAKGFSDVEAISVVSINALLGILGTVLSGWFSDKLFKGDRKVPALIFGVLNAAALALFFYGGNAMWVNVLSMVLFGIAIGVLICFLGGLMAVDIVPRKATGAALGVVGMTSYIAAGIQDVASGWLIDSNITVAADGVKHYDFGPVAIFWLAAAVISFLLPLLNRGKVKEF